MKDNNSMPNNESSESSASDSFLVGEHSNSNEDGMEVRELIEFLWAEKWVVISITLVAATISLILSLVMTDIYRAESVLAPAELEQSAGTLANQLGGAASLLGVNLGAGGSDKVSIAIAILRSREFTKRFIDEHDLLVQLFAGKWDGSERINEIDPSIYNELSGEWTRKNGKPTPQEAFRQFSSIVSIAGPARDSGLVTISIDWHDPVQASAWANNIVADINRDIKNRDVAEANNAIRYLQTQLQNTSLVEMQRALYQLIESQTRITMLADVRPEYVFRVIDPAVVPEVKIAPNSKLFCFVGTLFGGFLALVFVFLRRQFKRQGRQAV